MADAEAIVREHLIGAIRAHEMMRDADLSPVVAAARAMVDAFRKGNKVLVAGNGGSAADAQHFAAEMVVKFERERAGVPVVALTTDTSAMTAAANDLGFERVFARQVEALGRQGDILLAMSTSGRSPNVLAAVEAARARKMTSVALTGRDGGALGRAAGIHINVADASTARVQEVHATLLHAICALVEQEL
jgi:phosphoheptose isomerase